MTAPIVTKLSNGLRVVTDRVEHVETASVGMWIGAGTRREEPQVNGVAHMLEHMAFKGTHRRNARDIAEEIENVGGQLNAHTAREHTAYYAKVLKDDAELAIDLLGDILINSTFEPDELERERMVVLQEIGQTNDTPDDVVFDIFQETAFPDQGLGRPVLGTAEIVGNMSRDVLLGYMGTHYRARDMVFAASGKIDHDAVLRMVDARFSHIPTEIEARTEAARYVGGDRREARDLEQVHLLLGFRGIATQDPAFYAAAVLASALGGGMSSRLFQEIREVRGLVYSIYAFSSAYSDDGLFGIYAGTGENEVTELLPVLCDEVTKFADTVSQEEVARARSQLKASLLMGLESPGARCEQAAQQLLVYGRVLPVEEMVAKVDAVDVDAVANVARRIFRTHPTMTSIGPVGKIEPFDRVVGRLTA